jgi:hypothetical protein
MPTRGPFPETNDSFNTYFNLVYPYLNIVTNVTRLGISAVNLGDLTAQKTQWDILFPLSQSAATSTKQNRGERDDLRAEIEDTLRAIYDDIPESVFNATDRSTLNLPVRDTTHTTRGAITDIPVADGKSVGGGMVQFRVRVTQDATRASRHPLANGIEMKYIIINPAAAPASGGGSGTPTPGTPSGGSAAAPAAPASADDCQLTHFSPKSIFTVPFGASAAGKTLYCFFRWVNHTTPANSSGWTTVRVVHIS